MAINNVSLTQGGANTHINARVLVGLEPFASIAVVVDLASLANRGGN
jgi:hypothetical protein